MTKHIHINKFIRSWPARILLAITLGCFASAALLYQSLCAGDQAYAIAYSVSALVPLAFSTYLALHASFQNELLVKLNRQLEQAHGELQSSNQKLFEYAETDPMTGLANRRRFFRKLSDISDRVGPNTIAVIDVDYFKQLNDNYGHEAGDRALVLIADIIRKRSKFGDTVARIGGEEFAILMPSTNEKEAYRIAESIRQEIALAIFKPDEEIPYQLTVSIGLSTKIDRFGDDRQLLRDADLSMLEAKREGKNRTCPSDPLAIKNENDGAAFLDKLKTATL